MAQPCSAAVNHRSQVAVVMVPLPAQGHLNQLLQLSRLIAAYNIPVHYVCTSTHNQQANRRVHGWDPLAAANLHFHNLPIPDYQSPPPILHPNAANKFPSHLQPLFNALPHLRHPLAELIRSLSRTSDRVVVVHDSMMSSVVQDVAFIPNAESYVFHSISAFSIFWYFWEQMENPFPLHDHSLKENVVPSLEDCFSSEFIEFIIEEQKYLGLGSGCLYNSCKEVEGEYMDLIEKISKSTNVDQRHWAIGPFNPVEMRRNSFRHECLEWLDKQEPKSVVFVSFGTTTSLSDEQIKELANGLVESDLKFIWVLREADTGNLNSNEHETRKCDLPEGYDEVVGDRGIVVRDWAPQLEILSHGATGAFVSHCGWNSCMESISMGVPIVAWPMHSDQPRNAVLITEVLKIGVAVKAWDEKRNEIATSLTISTVLKRLMGPGEGAEIRRRAEELGGAVRRAVAEGGVTSLEMGSFIAHITR